MSTSALALVGDIGGTNARFALVDLSAPGIELRESKSLANADFASLQHAIEHYLAGVSAQPRRAALAVACPVGSDEIRLTNRAWSFSQRELQATLGLSELRMLNDFGAVAWAIPALQADDLVTLHGTFETPLQGPISVLGPGTGLGVALLVGSPQCGWQVVETEGGHVGFAPIGDEERAISAWLTAQHGRTSTERLLCGKGLSEIDAVLRSAGAETSLEMPPLRDPADVVQTALEGHDIPARQALARFCAVLGSVAGDCALIHGARSVVIAGGIMPRFIPFLRSSAFRERFLAKGRMAALLESVPIHVITHPHPGLLGAACALRATES
ncbi:MULTISPECIES: glucokinase [Thermomonas]|uniref:Glucokinase n=1 Tax=Thermomonas beijingensis TaxID=2872701 RepID=A0ABS7TBY6_9GAMM|nr:MULTISPECIES: glucokinase [Thermomonas]MBS0460203.1 glucokinase [Pseudomonadota bacterium]MBZ4185310.1 glucokinase [Thermomonas beijingensis]HOC11058.1 glucokinase [Thermomonas sp.]HQA02153.1 glucokinase [Thermomonas sp.]HQE07657.1 glucokinase [Thermomonas sp.]